MSTVALSVVMLIAAVLVLQAEEAEAKALDESVREHRMGHLTVRAEPGAEVKVTQTEHEFWFGTALSARMFRPDADPDERRQYLQLVKQNFNSAVHENALKWYSTERQRGNVSYQGADRMLRWCEESGIRVRGHCIFWAVPKYVQDWVKDLDDAELREAVERRAKEVTSRYRGRIVEYDVNNEMLHGDYYAERLGREIRVEMFRWAREGAPRARLFVNDYNILSGEDVEEYAEQIERLLQAGAPVAGIGCQGHFGPEVDMGAVRRSLDRLARFDLPIRVTEFDINTDDEEKKARVLEEFYRACFAHPAVEGILMWGFWRGRHWRPDAALWTRDFTPTPAAEAYRRLVFSEWWTRWEGVADGRGECSLPAFYGRHRVECEDRSSEVTLSSVEAAAEVDMR